MKQNSFSSSIDSPKKRKNHFSSNGGDDNQQNVGQSPRKSKNGTEKETPQRRRLMDTYGQGSDEALKKKLQDLVSSSITEFPKTQDPNLPSSTRYLDLSNITGQPINFNIIPQNIVVLRLTHTNISSLQGFPMLPALRTLYLDSCNISSLEGMPRLPKLRYLYLNDNILTNYKGMPILPELTELDMSNNPADFKVTTALQACGSIGLGTFNGASVTVSDIRTAFSHSPLVGVALRSGLEPETATNEDALNYMSQDIVKYLVDKGFEEGTPVLTFTGSDDEGWFVIFPIQLKLPSNGKKQKPVEEGTIIANDIKWYMNTCPITSNGEEWELLTQKQLNMIEIKTTMYQHIIKATFRINDSQQVFSMYTDNVIGYQEGTLMLPFPVTPRVSGEPREGSLISTIPMPVPTKSSWYIEGEPILENSDTLTLTAEHIGKEITCAIQPFCPDLPQVRFNELLTMTEVVVPLAPKVKGIVFPNDIVEGIEFQMQKLFTPNREGNSRVAIERAKSASDEWTHCAILNPSSLVYTPTNEDVGSFLRLVYEPVLDDGTVAEEPFYFYSKSRVVPSLPVIKNAKLAGDFLVGRKIIAIGDYSGGRKGECVYEWFSSSKPFEKMRDIKKATKIQNTSNSEVFVPGEAEIDRYIACLITPIRDDDVVGDQIVATSKNPIQDDPEPPEKISIPEKILAFRPINVPFDCNWFISSTEDPTGFEHADSGVGMEFTPNERHIGRFIRITKVNEPGCSYILGQVFSGPAFVADFELEVSSPYDTGVASIPEEIDLENFEVIWIRMTGNKEIVVDVDTRKYTFTEQDIGSQIKAAITHISTDTNERGVTTFSAPTKKIMKSVRGRPVISGKLQVGKELTVSISKDTKDNIPIIESCKWYKSRDRTSWQTAVCYSFYQIDKNTEEITYKCTEGRTVDHPLLFADLSFPLTDAEIDHYIKVELTVGEFTSISKTRKTQVKSTGEILSTLAKDRVKCSDFQIILQNKEQEFYLEGRKATVSTKGVFEENTSTVIVWERESFDDHNEEEWIIVGEGLSYKFTLDDIGQTIRCRPWLKQERRSGQTHPEIGTVSRLSEEDLSNNVIVFSDIRAKSPQVTDVEVEQSATGQIVIRGLYKGGSEGKSVFYISYMDDDQHTLHHVEMENIQGEQLPDGRSEYKMYPWDSLFRRETTTLSSVKIDAAYKPVRDDGLDGVPVWSSKSITISSIPIVEKASIKGSSGNHFCSGDTLTCLVKATDAKKCEFEWTIKRKPTEKERAKFTREKKPLSSSAKSSSSNLSPVKQSNTTTTYDSETDILTYTILRSETASYTLKETDNNAQFSCTIWAIGRNGFESIPKTIDFSPNVAATRSNPRLEIRLSAEPEDTKQKAVIKATKRASSALQRAERGSNDFYSGDVLEAIFEDTEEQDVFWIIRNNNKADKDDEEYDVISTEQSMRLNASYVGQYIQVISEDQQFRSDIIGPIQASSSLESLAKAASRANSFRFKGHAPVGNGQWDCQMSNDGMTIVGRNKVSKKTNWNDTNISMNGSNQLEITNGPGSRFVMVPSLDERDKKGIKSTEEVRDLIYTIYKLYKGN